MKATSAKIKAIITEVTGKKRIINGSVCMWDAERNMGCIITPASDDFFYKSIIALKKEIKGKMQYGNYEPKDCSWACGNEEELAELANMAGIGAWVKGEEKKLGIAK
jgi:hypothetical protein